MAPVQSSQPLDFLKLLAHELRWKLVSTLTRGDYRVQELVEVVQQPQNLVSYHLKQLRDGHLVRERRSTADARDIYYSLDLLQMQTYYEALGQALHPALYRQVAPAALSGHKNIRVLFLCTENSARSQMAEGILRHRDQGQVEVFSAGTAPTSIHPYAVRVLSEMGIDIAAQRAKDVAEFQGQSFDYVVTVCDRARENCPVFAHDTQRIHWSLPDPASITDNQYAAFEETARQLVARARYFLSQLAAQKEAIL